MRHLRQRLATRLGVVSATALLAFGAVACEDESQGPEVGADVGDVQEDPGLDEGPTEASR